ncbi:MAG: HAD-IA family hydrolase [Planctomycetes bacterium]|nr:HAD-IA family hydrolase [Planctomycetota bacterium]MCW8134280.1 HAD-IA family hydrolase [Planctomycetota bacterium]
MLARIRTVLFDLDGTLAAPTIDFDALRQKLGLPRGMSIMHALEQLDAPARARAMQVVEEAEREAAARAAPNPGALELVAALRDRGIGMAIITRNMHEAAAATLRAIGIEVDVLVTREFGPIKPSPEPVLHALERLGALAASALMVGDFKDDMTAGRQAGTATCLIMNNAGPPRYEADLHVPSPIELLQLFEEAWQ